MALPPFRGKEGIRIANRRLTPPPRPEESRFRQYVALSTHPSGEPSRHFRRDVLDSFFSTLPSVAAGFQLKTWRGGPEAGKPKLSPTAAGLLDRGLMRLDTGHRLPRLFFTEAGLTALRAMMADRRLADPAKFAHIRQELGIDPVPDTDPPQD